MTYVPQPTDVHQYSFNWARVDQQLISFTVFIKDFTSPQSLAARIVDTVKITLPSSTVGLGTC